MRGKEKILLVSFVILYLSTCCFAEKSSAVIVGTSENFDELIEENEFVLVEFYAPWCGHCKKLEPEYEKAAQMLKDEGDKAVLVKVDATIESKLAEKFSVRGFPTIIFFKNEEQIPFDGDRTAVSIVRWIKKKCSPPTTLLKSEEEETELLNKGNSVVGVFTNEESKAFTAFFKVAKEEEDFSFGHRFIDGVEEKITLSNEAKEVKKFTDSKMTKKTIKDWVQNEGYPLVVELDQKVWQRSNAAKTPLFTLFFNPEQLTTFKPMLNAVAEQNKGKIITAWMDGVTNQQLVSSWGGSGDVLPTAFLVTFPTQNPKVLAWNEETEKEVNEESLQAFIRDGLEGKYTSFKKSQPIPEKNDGPVKVVVGKNFDEIVNDPNRDVLLEFYAPWCGHCKTLEPIYTELGNKFANIESITIAKIDATANAYPDDITIQGFPTILFFPANDKSNPLLFEGGRELNDLTSFIIEKATHKIQLPEEVKVDL